MGNDEVTSEQPRSCEISKQVFKELEALPPSIRGQFLVAIERLQNGFDPGLPISYLTSVDKGVAELKINGRPAHRLVYTTKFAGKLVILAARPKTCQGQDQSLVDVARKRLKAYR